MKIHVKTTNDVLYSTLYSVISPAFNGVEHIGAALTVGQIDWTLIKTTPIVDITELVFQQGAPTVLIVDAEDTALLSNLQNSQAALQHLINVSRHPKLIRCPIILVFNSPATLSQYQGLPEFAADWILAASLPTEVLPRIIGALKRAQALPSVQRHASLTLIPTTRTMIYENTSARLTPAEYTLLELFLGNIGSIISLQELVQTFRASGKSTEANNIRVAIYQLRLKLDTLTKSQMPLTSIYRQGYCLRHKINSANMPMPMHIKGSRSNMQSPV